jgi:hypothetical protein
MGNAAIPCGGGRLEPASASARGKMLGAWLQSTAENDAVERGQPRMQRIAAAPLTIVEKRPIEIGADVDPLGAAAGDLGQGRVDPVDAAAVVAGGDAGLDDVDRLGGELAGAADHLTDGGGIFVAAPVIWRRVAAAPSRARRSAAAYSSGRRLIAFPNRAPSGAISAAFHLRRDIPVAHALETLGRECGADRKVARTRLDRGIGAPLGYEQVRVDPGLPRYC